MKISHILETSAGATASGSVSPVSAVVGTTQTRNQGIYPDTKGGNLLKGKKTKKAFANSLHEGAESANTAFMQGYSRGLKFYRKGPANPYEKGSEEFNDYNDGYQNGEADSHEKYDSSGMNESHDGCRVCGQTPCNCTHVVAEVAPPGAKAERMVKHIKKGYAKDGKLTPKEKSIAYATAWKAHNKGQVEESEINEADLIMVPGQGHKLKPGFISKDADRTDREVEMALSDLFQAHKNSKEIFELVKNISEEEGLEGWVQEKIIKSADYLNTIREYLEGKLATGQLSEEGTATVAKTWDQMTPKEKISGVKGRTVWNPATNKYLTVFDVPAAKPKEQGVAETRGEIHADFAKDQGRFTNDTTSTVGGTSMKRIQVGDTVKYLGQKAEVLELSKDGKHARVEIESGMGSTTQNVLTSDLKQLGQGVAEEGPGAMGSGGFGTNYPGTYEETHGKLKNDKMHHNRALTTEDEVEEDLSRRGFLRGMGAAATGAALASTGAKAMASQEADPTSLKGLTAEQAAYKLAYQQALNAHPNPNSAMAKLNAQRVAQAAAKAASGNGTHVQGKLVKSEPQAEPSQRIQPSSRRAGAGMMESAILSGVRKV